MPKALDIIAHEVLELPRNQQMQLAHDILSWKDAPFDPVIEQAWEDEICARIQAVQEGRAALIPWEEALTRIQEKLNISLVPQRNS